MSACTAQGLTQAQAVTQEEFCLKFLEWIMNNGYNL